MISTRDIFARHNLRCTPQRRAIYDALRETSAHPTAEALHRKVLEQQESVSLATVYNTLDTLAAHGLVQKIPSEDGCCRYDANIEQHLHLKIAETGEIRDVPAHLSRELLQHIPASILEKIEYVTASRISEVQVQFIAHHADPQPASSASRPSVT